MVTILCWGGIGDTLRNLALVPHAALYRALGYRCRVVHRNRREAACLEHAEAPEPEFFEALIARCPSLWWRGESGEHRGLSRLLNRGLRDLLKALHGGSPRYYRFALHLTDAERRALPARPPGLAIGVQTHLSGMRTKQWGLENWRAFLERMLAAYPGASLLLLDSAPEVRQLCFDDRISSTLGLSIAQSISLCEQMDLLVSIDSWTKYVGSWVRLPQVIVVPDQRAEYPGLTAEKLAREEFAGILDQPRNTIIGLRQTPDGPELTLPSIQNLTPDELLAAVAARLRQVGYPS